MPNRFSAAVLKSALAVALLCANLQAAAADAKPASAPASAPITPAKQELVQRLLKLWHVETLGQSMLQEPVADAVNQARAMLQGRATPEKRDAALREIAADAKKFLEDSAPIVTGSAQKLIPSTVAPLLAERFSEDELRQIIAMLESPVKRKFEALAPELQKSLGEKIAADTRPVIDPKLQELQQRIGMRLRSAVAP
ncbi:MAG TPA: DUF2059 domain-containing protein [Paucimonas sp.]|nr:DUF2059 domain-containing protein [Paucimonas sp.]